MFIILFKYRFRVIFHHVNTIIDQLSSEGVTANDFEMGPLKTCNAEAAKRRVETRATADAQERIPTADTPIRRHVSSPFADPPIRRYADMFLHPPLRSIDRIDQLAKPLSLRLATLAEEAKKAKVDRSNFLRVL
jgi:hypothetical protein